MQKVTPLFFVFILWGMLAWLSPAHAGVIINDQGATELKKSVENELLWRTALSKITGHGLGINGAITVTPKTDFYEVKLPNLSMSFGPQQRLGIGTVTINAVPGKDGEWMTSVALPATMTLYNGIQTPLANITLGKQHFASAWIPAKGIHPRFDSLYQDILVKIPGADSAEIAIGSLKAVSKLKDNKDNTWSGQGSLEAKDVKVTTSGKNAMQLAVKKINGVNIYDRLDILQEQEIKKKIQDIAAAGQAPTELKNLDFINGLVSATQGAVDNFNNSFTAEDIRLRINSDPAQKLPAQEYTLDKMTFQGSLQGGRQEKAAISFKGGFDGVKLPTSADSLTGLVPQTLNIGINIDNLPVKRATEMMFDNLRKSVEPPKSGEKPSPAAENAAQEQQVRAIFASLMQILQNAGTSFSVQNTFLRSQDLEAVITGKLDANSAAVLGMTGKITLSLKGVEELLLKLKTMAAQPGANPKVNDYINGLTVLMMMGQPGMAADGKSVYNYPFEMKEDTKTLLDGMGAPSPVNPQQTPIPPAGATAP